MRISKERWEETIDGLKHLVEVNYDEDQIIIKDLGVLHDRLLPCPFCREYPEILHSKEGFAVYHKCNNDITIKGNYETEQQAIDAWNRRV